MCTFKNFNLYPFLTLINLELTSEEITARRRAERKQFKLDRARAIAAVAEEAETVFEIEGRVIQPALSGPTIPSAATWRPSPQPISENNIPPTPEEEILDDGEPPEDIEHLQLTLQEAFFLLWNLDCLTVFDPHSVRCCDFTVFTKPSSHHDVDETNDFATNMDRFPNG